MATVTSIKQYRQLTNKRIKELKKNADRSSLSAASFQVLQAKRLAPRGTTGQLRGNIRKRKLKSGKWRAESWVPGNFKYNFWVNRSPIKSINYPKGAWIPARKSKRGRSVQVAKPGTKAVYGISPNWRWTGTPGYWGIATSRTRKHFRKVSRDNTAKALRVKI